MEAFDDINEGVSFNGMERNNIRYADDKNLLLVSPQGLQNLLHIVADTSNEFGLKLYIEQNLLLSAETQTHLTMG